MMRETCIQKNNTCGETCVSNSCADERVASQVIKTPAGLLNTEMALSRVCDRNSGMVY